MNAHRVKVFNGANDNAVVGVVTHDFHFVFFPTEKAFFDEYFSSGREVETTVNDYFEFLLVIGDATTGSTESEGWPDDEGHRANFISDDFGFFHGVSYAGDWKIEADLDHGIFEPLSIFTFVNGIGVCPDHFDAELVQRAGMEEIHGNVECGLAPEGGKKSVRLLFDNNFLNDLGRDWLDVGPLGKLRISHDGGRIGVY